MTQQNDAVTTYPKHPSPLARVLRGVSFVLPGEYLKTAFYLNCIDLPRRILRDALFSFYRFDHVYAVLKEFSGHYRGNFSILEFGTSDGYAFVKLLYATRYLGLEKRVTVHTFDSFEGMPPPVDEKDQDWIARDDWLPGQYRGGYEALEADCAARYSNYRIHKGYFERSLSGDFFASLADAPPILVWFDCDYYSSTRTVFERLLDHLPNGAVLYFDELELNFGSRYTGEARLVHEANAGEFGPGIELIPDTRLSLSSRRVYRFFRMPPNRTLVPLKKRYAVNEVHRHGDGSPLP
jgi:hypothetical protein